jgi:hypothetical protein
MAMNALRIIVGAGGHGKSIASVAMTMGFQIDGFVDDNPALSGATICGVPVLGATTLIGERPEWELLAGIGSNRVRQLLARRHAHARWIGLEYAKVHRSVYATVAETLPSSAPMSRSATSPSSAPRSPSATTRLSATMRNLPPACRSPGAAGSAKAP